MKILMLTTSFPKGEGEYSGRFVFRLAESLASAGAGVKVVAPSERGLPSRERMGGVEVHRFSYFVPRWQRLAYRSGIPDNLRRSLAARLQVGPFFLSFLRCALKESAGCDLLHAHWTVSALAGLAPARLRGLPLVLSVRGSDVNLRWRPLRRLNRFVLPRVDSLIAVSGSVARSLSEMGHRSAVVPNGVDLPPRPPREAVEARRLLDLPEGRFTLLFLGRLAGVKDPLFLLDAFRRLLREGADAHLLFVGGGALEGRLREKTRDLAGRVRFAGRVAAPETGIWIEACDVCVLTSRSEGRPNAVLEAMARERPVVALDAGGTGELVRDGENGFLLPRERPDLFVEALRRLEGDGALRKRMGLRGRALLSEWGLTWERSAARTLEVYRSLLQSRRRGRGP